MARSRSAATRAPQTTEQALALADRFAVKAAAVEFTIAQRDAELQKINAAADSILVPLDAELKDLAKQLKPWFEVNFDKLTDGKRKSIELGGCLIGYRMSPPKVAFADGTDEDAANVLIAASLASSFVRVKPAPDKPAILKHLEFVAPETPNEDEQAMLLLQARLRALGFSVKQTEQFFIDCLREDAGA